MQPTSRHRSRRQRGQTLVETALTLLGSLMLVIGTVDLAQLLLHMQWMSDRARDTARWAATHTDNVEAIKRYAAYGSAAATQTTPGIMGLVKDNVTVNVVGNRNSPEYRIEVSIVKPLPLFTPMLPSSYTPRPAVASSPAESLGSTGVLNP